MLKIKLNFSDADKDMQEISETLLKQELTSSRLFAIELHHSFRLRRAKALIRIFWVAQ